MERVIQFTMREREIKALLAVLDVWNVLFVSTGLFQGPPVLDKFLEEGAKAQGWPNDQIVKAKQIVRERMGFLIRGESFEDSPLAWLELLHNELETKLREEA